MTNNVARSRYVSGDVSADDAVRFGPNLLHPPTKSNFLCSPVAFSTTPPTCTCHFLPRTVQWIYLAQLTPRNRPIHTSTQVPTATKHSPVFLKPILLGSPLQSVTPHTSAHLHGGTTASHARRIKGVRNERDRRFAQAKLLVSCDAMPRHQVNGSRRFEGL